MKAFILTLFLFTGILVFAQNGHPEIPVDTVTNLIKFQQTVDEIGTQDELFNRCVYWLNDFYKDPQRVTTIRDVPSGKIEGRHQFRIYYYEDNDSIKHPAGMVKYTFTIQFKDDKYRYTIDELFLKAQTNLPIEKWLDKDDPAYDKRWDSYLQQVADYVEDWSQSLEMKMKPETQEVEDDW